MTPLLSAIVPCYNIALYLPDCLDSLLSQTLQNLEIIVVDDGSTDESGEIADDFAARDSRITVLHVPNGGLGSARNIGAAAATGTYLMFVDGDDLVPPRAFDQLTGSLERTGSDIAAGNAWRFSRTMGTQLSWTHRQVFTQERLRTHINEFPLLIRDRMVWNKAYRRSFWVEQGFEFPHIVYEDYPVTMAAHLAAGTVDVLDTFVYMWRQRESGDSITQQLESVANARDRVTSAEMVLDIVDRDGTEEVRNAINAYLTDVDLVALGRVMTHPDPQDRQQADELALRLAKRLQPQRDGVTRLARLMHRTLRSGAVDAARAMAIWRQGGDKRQLVRALGRAGDPRLIPATLAAITPRRSQPNPLRPRRLRTTLLEARPLNAGLELDIEVLLRRQLIARADVRAEVELATGSRASLKCRVKPTRTGATVTATIPAGVISAIDGGTGRLQVFVGLGPLRWRGHISFDPDQVPGPMPLEDGRWLLLGRDQPQNQFLRLVTLEAPEIATAELTPSTLTLKVASGDGYAAILRPYPTAPLVTDLHGGIASFDVSQVPGGDLADNAFTTRANRDVVIVPCGWADSLEAAQEKIQGSLLGYHQPEEGAASTETGGNLTREEQAEADSALAELGESDVAQPNQLMPWRAVYSHGYGEPVDVGCHRLWLAPNTSGALEIIHQRIDHIREVT
ncbi:MAG: glycosyltransferase [Arachnia sp.]